ncbi:Zn-binding domain-containing protein, partial [Staphylococcus shinii]
HTLSHGLIKQFSKLSGYSITSISEKLYFYKNKYGLLIYVTDSDKDGTFGGLVRLAEEEKFKQSFNEALKSMEWCSSDPVCREIGRENGQGLYYSNGAACHNCSYLPNTSCSYRNCFLDREFVFVLDSNVCIRNYFDWFKEINFHNNKQEHKVKIVKNGEENTYGNWNTLIDLGIATSSYFLNEGYTEPDYLEGIVQIDDYEFTAAYIWKEESRIVLLEEKYQSKEIPSEFFGVINGWEILKNK